MSRRTLVVAAILSLSLSPALFAQGRGGQNQGSQHKQRPAATGQQRAGQQQQKGQRVGTREQQRQRIHATEQQRDQHRTCTQSAERVRTQAREMAQAAKGGGYNNEEFRRQHEQLRNEIRAMQEEHNRYMQGLSEERRAQLQDRIRQMEQSRERLHTQLQDMDRELNQANPDRKRLEKHAREMEKTMKQWQQQYHHMGSEMDIEP